MTGWLRQASKVERIHYAKPSRAFGRVLCTEGTSSSVKLWRNGRTLSVEDLVGSSQYAAYSSWELEEMNVQGQILASAIKDGTRRALLLLPIDLAPEVLAVNTNFDEGDTDSTTHAAKPDCANGTLKAKKDHLDGKWQEGDIVTDDLHKGFFGLRPGTLPYSETAGAVVKIKKLDKNDPETNRKQSGHVRLYAVWGTQGSESEMKLELYDKDSLVANDIGPQLYHQNPNTPVTFYLEGVEPGKITLEFSYQKGSTSFKHE